MDEMLQSAITKIRIKNTPNTESKNFAIPEEAHKGIYPILEVWGVDTQDPDINYKAKFIHDFLSEEEGKVSDKIVDIMSSLPNISSEPNIERIYKWCRLRDEHRKATNKAEMLKKRLKQI